MAQVYRHVGRLKPGKSGFNNSFTVQFNCDMGQIIPVHMEEAVPGDITTINMEAVVRFQPLVAPVLHEIYMRTFWYFVPNRLIMNRKTMEELGDNGEWEEFITGGSDGKDTTTLPLWTPPVGGYGKYSLWDYLTFPLGVVPTEDSKPLSFSKRCYNLIWNEYFRDQNLQDPVSLDSDVILPISWSKDRFTTALYDTQRGDKVAIPLEGLGSLSFNGEASVYGIGMPVMMNDVNANSLNLGGNVVSPQQYIQSRVSIGSSLPGSSGWSNNLGVSLGNTGGQRFINWLNTNSFDLSNVGGIGINDLRRTVQLQKMLERNMRCGSRYVEQLFGRFGIYPEDVRLQRPEWIGATRQPIIISEVLNTTSTNSTDPNVPTRHQGDMAGHGITAEKSFVGRYRVKEHGYIVGLMCVQPVPLYEGGINRQWQRRTRFDFMTPEFVNLSEIAVKNSELVVTGTSRDDEIFGYQGIYDELRIKESRVCADMRPAGAFHYWNLARDDYDKDNPPSLNANFIECVPSKKIFAVQDEPGLIVNFASIVKNLRPMPLIGEPGLIDHH